MPDDPQKPRVGTYGSDATVAEATPGKSTETPAKKKGLGLPSWAIGLIVLALVILVIRAIF